MRIPLSQSAHRRPSLMLCMLLLAACSDPVPTSVVVQIQNRVFDVADQVTVTIYDGSGLATHSRLEPEAAAIFSFPNTVVLYPPQPGPLRLLIRAQKATQTAEGAATVVVKRGEQITTAVVLDGVLNDEDGDGVPDVIDNCVAWPNPQQQPCHSDGGMDAAHDAGPSDGAEDGDPRGEGMGKTDGGVADVPKDGLMPVDTLRPDMPGPDTLRPDTLRPDTLRPDTVKPDTLRPDTLRPDTLRPPCTCPLGCRATGGCREPLPSNAPWPSSFAPAISVSSGSLLPLDTTACTRAGASVANDLCILAIDALTINGDGRIKITGDRPLLVLVNGDVFVSGSALIDLSATASTPGPGGGMGGIPLNNEGPGVNGSGPGGGETCLCGSGNADDCGGGGASYATYGGAGGPDDDTCFPYAPDPGRLYGTPTLTPLLGGSGGASGGQARGDALSASRGGGGGGALQITSSGTITINGSINAGGGGGQSGSVDWQSSGGAGGSGGAVLLEAAVIQGSGAIAANGGGGGNGTTYICRGTDGEDASVGLVPAKGGTPCVAGGDGAAGATAAQPGERGSSSAGGGGGGGGLGRVRLNSGAQSAPPKTLTISGQHTFGILVGQ